MLFLFSARFPIFLKNISNSIMHSVAELQASSPSSFDPDRGGMIRTIPQSSQHGNNAQRMGILENR